MRISQLTLRQFRNYPKAHFQFSPGTNVIVGQNANGKTNLIEAIYLLSVAKSFRTRINTEMVMFDTSFAKIEGDVDAHSRHYHLEMVLSQEGKRAKVNGHEMTKSSDFVGIINVVVFTPDDLFLIKGSPRERRRFMDIELSKLSNSYLYHFNQFSHLLKERNLYLKSEKIDPVYLDVLTSQLVDEQLILIARRQSFVSKLNVEAQKAYARIASQKESMTVTYQSGFDLTASDLRQSLMHTYAHDRERDIRFGMTHHGIHKDDLMIALNEREAHLYASQGQQRSIVLALKIALLQLIYDEIGEYPILLLDDVLSELDDRRKTMLLDLLNDKIQTFITTTSLEGLSHQVISRAYKIEIRNRKESR